MLLGEAVISNIDSASDLTPELVEAWQKSLLLLRVMHEEDKKGSHNTRGEEDPSVFRVLHCASAVECPRCVLRIATILYPDQLTIPDEDGRLPLHIATKAPVYVSTPWICSCRYNTTYYVKLNDLSYYLSSACPRLGG